MPVNILRLNQKQHHPNDRIAFIKPLEHIGEPDKKAKADLFLRKVAAICYPIMKAHSLSITTLEEFPPNREFMGRNFNGGEVIQLVLRRMPDRRGGAVATYGESARAITAPSGSDSDAPRQVPHGIRIENRVGRIDPDTSDFVANRDDGGWLPLRTVQMVMMHELAHCKEMNHSKYFWAVRNEYVVHLKVLFGQGYTGEGMWGRGQDLSNGHFIESGAGGADDFAELCGGAYRGRGRKRGKGAKEKVTYAERKKRKLEKTEKKFGKGEAIGQSEIGAMLSEGKAKPRVAKSKRGRELRAAAALARFDKAKIDQAKVAVKTEDDDETASESETESEDEDHLLDQSGQAVKDAKGNDLYRVCGDTDAGADRNARDELSELNEIEDADDTGCVEPTADDEDDLDVVRKSAKEAQRSTIAASVYKPPDAPSNAGPDDVAKKRQASIVISRGPAGAPATKATNHPIINACRVCTLVNEPAATTCDACGSVLKDAGWTCRTHECLMTEYRNAQDASTCGLCGKAKGTT